MQRPSLKAWKLHWPSAIVGAIVGGLAIFVVGPSWMTQGDASSVTKTTRAQATDAAAGNDGSVPDRKWIESATRDLQRKRAEIQAARRAIGGDAIVVEGVGGDGDHGDPARRGFTPTQQPSN